MARVQERYRQALKENLDLKRENQRISQELEDETQRANTLARLSMQHGSNNETYKMVMANSSYFV